MSNLAAQFISQSYQSVINVGTGSGASITSTLQPLTDGYGTVSPISVSTTDVAIQGTLSITGSIIPFSTSSVSGAYDLGSPSKPWRHLYVSSGSVYLDGNRVMGLTNDTNNLHFIAPTGSQIQMGTNVFFQNPEVSLNPGLILEATGEETGSSIYFNGGKGQIWSEGDLNFLLVSGDTNNNPSASINFSVGSVESGSINLFGKSSQISQDYLGDISLFSISGSINSIAQSGSISLVHQQYNGGLQIVPGYMQLRQNDLDGGITITSQSVVVSSNQASSLFEVNMVQGQIALLSQDDISISSSLGTINTYGTASFIGDVNIIGGPLAVSASAGTTFGIDVVNGGIQSKGYIKSLNAINVNDIFTVDGSYGQYVPVNVTGQYAFITAQVHSHDEANPPFLGHTIDDLDDSNNNAGFFGTYMDGVTSGSYGIQFNGGGMTNNHSNDSAIWRSFGGNRFEILKDTYLTGSLNVSGSQNIAGNINLSGSEFVSGAINIYKGDGGNGLEIYNSGIYSEGTIVSRNGVTLASSTPNLNLQSNLEGSGSAYALANIFIDGDTDPTNVFSGIYMPVTGGNEFDFVVSSYSSYYGGTPVGMILAGGNNNDGNNTAIAFPSDGTMQVFKDTTLNKNVNVVGYLQSSNSFTQAKMTSGQTVTAGSDTVVGFNSVNVNNNGWFDTTTHVFTPTVAGTYEISFVLNIAAGTGNGQMNAQVNKNNGTQMLIIQKEVNKNVTDVLQGSVLVELNGSTDNIRITFYTSSNSGSQVINDNNGTFFKAVLL